MSRLLLILFLLPQLFPVLSRRHAEFRPEVPVEGGDIDKAAAEGNIRDAPVCVADISYRMFHTDVIQVAAEAASEIFPEKLGHILRRQMKIVRQVRERNGSLVMRADIFLNLPYPAVIFPAGSHLCPGRVNPEILGQNIQELEETSRNRQSVISGIVEVFTGDRGKDPPDRIVIPVRFQNGIAQNPVFRAGRLFDEGRRNPDVENNTGRFRVQFIVLAAGNHGQVPLGIQKRRFFSPADPQRPGKQIQDLKGLARTGGAVLQMFLGQEGDREIDCLHKTSSEIKAYFGR